MLFAGRGTLRAADGVTFALGRLTKGRVGTKIGLLARKDLGLGNKAIFVDGDLVDKVTGVLSSTIVTFFKVRVAIGNQVVLSVFLFLKSWAFADLFAKVLAGGSLFPKSAARKYGAEAKEKNSFKD